MVSRFSPIKAIHNTTPSLPDKRNAIPNFGQITEDYKNITPKPLPKHLSMHQQGGIQVFKDRV